MFWILGAIFTAPTANAATINVVAGTDSFEENGQCQLSEAIENINNSDQIQADCGAGDGNNDTIIIPAGTIYTSETSMFRIQRSMTIIGQGMGQTVINGGGSTRGFNIYNLSNQNDTVTISGMTITAWRGYAVESTQGNLNLENVEADGQDAVMIGSGEGAINVSNGEGVDSAINTISANNVYIHNVSVDNGYIHMFDIWTTAGNSLSIDINNVTIEDIYNASGGINIMPIGVGLFTFNNASGYFDGTISNLTINNISAPSGGVATVNPVAFATTGNGTSDANVQLNNATISNIVSGTSSFGVPGVIGPVGVSSTEDDISNAVLQANNVIITNAIFDGSTSSCFVSDIASFFAATGVSNLSFTSSGGNISDDTSCSSYFTDPTDQNNVDPADLMLGTLGNYGGSIPTIPLLPGSIAIDSGTTVAGLTTDARGTTRPQCSAFDSGAYEYNGTCPTTTTGEGNVLTYPDPITSSTVTLELSSDVTNGTVSAISPDIIPKDTFFFYPLGLTSFQFDTTIGATKTITLYYDLPGDPSSYTARKYNTNTKTFSTITNATITRVTYNNKSMIRLTYDITDGGLLDQDNTANGTIVDPVGLAQATVGVPDTGLGKMR